MSGHLLSGSEGFAADPFGYSSLAWHKWGLLATASGFPVDISKPPTVTDLKNPVLWLCHAHALAEAAVQLVRNPPSFDSFPEELRTICHSQYHAAALMLVGYSLEVCLKAMILLRIGVEEFIKQERDHFHHRLDELANFIPGLSEKEKAVLRGLTHFVVWAGRYPDPGSKRIMNTSEVFDLSENFQIDAKDLFTLSAKVMKHVQAVVQ